MEKLVTICIPVYKRLNTLARALQSVAAQDYPHIELIVSDNGQNGNKVKEIVEQWYPRPFRFRQNPSTVPISPHYNQLIEAATGQYCVVLDDDDTLSQDFVSELAGILDANPEVAVALAMQESVDTMGRVLHRSQDRLPRILRGEDFIRSWSSYGFECYTAMFGRTALMQSCGGYEDFPRGTHSDDALLVKLCLNGSMAFGQHCTFSWQINDSSYGWSMSCDELAEDTRQFLHFIEHHPTITRYAALQPVKWEELKPFLLALGWRTYFDRWNTMYKERMSYGQWVKAAFALPYIPEYYRLVRFSLKYGTREAAINGLKAHLPWVPALYRALTGRPNPSNK
jgi:glycosyltransferase involved in cell wall biosynthesis